MLELMNYGFDKKLRAHFHLSSSRNYIESFTRFSESEQF